MKYITIVSIVLFSLQPWISAFRLETRNIRGDEGTNGTIFGTPDTIESSVEPGLQTELSNITNMDACILWFFETRTQATCCNEAEKACLAYLQNVTNFSSQTSQNKPKRAKTSFYAKRARKSGSIAAANPFLSKTIRNNFDEIDYTKTSFNRFIQHYDESTLAAKPEPSAFVQFIFKILKDRVPLFGNWRNH